MQWSPRRSELRLYVCGFCEVESARGGHGTRRAITARVRIRGDTVVLAEEWRLEIRAGSTSDPVPVELERGGWRGGLADTCRRRGWAWAVCPVFDRRVWRRCLYGGLATRRRETKSGRNFLPDPNGVPRHAADIRPRHPLVDRCTEHVARCATLQQRRPDSVVGNFEVVRQSAFFAIHASVAF